MSDPVQVTIVDVDTDSAVLVEGTTSDTITDTVEVSSLTVEDEDLNIIEVGIQGPTGPAGQGDSAYARRVDMSGDTVIYKAQAAPGSVDDAPVWRISKTVIGDEVVTTWAVSATFACRWTDRTTYTYE
jgi:hypothetical protein